MAMENGSLSASDVALLSGSNGFGGFAGGFEGLIYLAVIAAMFGGGFGGFGLGGNAAGAAVATGMATQNDVQRGFDNQNLQAQTRDILAAVTGGTAQTIAASTQNAQNAINAIKDGNAALIREFGNVETALTALGGKQQECCCNILRATDQVRYDGAVNTAAINANTTAQVQKVLDAIVGNRMADMQSQINALQLQAATAGMMKFPNAWTFNGGYFPPLQPAATAAG
jgi:hypothetical protein